MTTGPVPEVLFDRLAERNLHGSTKEVGSFHGNSSVTFRQPLSFCLIAGDSVPKT